MEYDPIKQTLGRLFNRYSFTRKLFYFLLDVLLLRTWHIQREIRRFFRQEGGKPGQHVLDAGSGFGQYTWFMARRQPSWQVHAIDIKAEEVDSAASFFRQCKQHNIRCEVADLLQFVEPDRYRLILSVDVMEHIEEDEKVFAHFFRSLQKGGMLLISTPSDQGGSGVHAEGEESFIGEHVRDGYNVNDIREKLERAGFSDIETRYTYGWPGKISWRLSMKYPIMLLGRSRWFLLLLPFYYLLLMPLVLLLNLADLHIRHTSGTGLLVRGWKK
jgi:SAM-dependent methyltransferase